ncbi:MAG TPA: hypothetical protein VET84_08185 [Stellaceae bacterium]|nr:hypothetical protein [Stellaceae bacterium]
MRSGVSCLDGPAARTVAAVIAAIALGLIAWLIYLDNREDPAFAACIRQQTAAIEKARDQGILPPDAARRFLDNVASSCAAQTNGMR